MHGAIFSTSSSTSQARAGGTGTVKEWSISMLIVSHSLWPDSISELCPVSVRISKNTSGAPRQPGARLRPGSCSGGVQYPEALSQPALGQARQLGGQGQPGPEALGQVLHLPDLALVGAQGRDLAREGRG